MKAIVLFLLLPTMVIIVGCVRQQVDYTRRASAVCELHRISMAKTNVPIEYGLIRLSEWGRALKTASSNSFPHAEVDVLGGCIVDTPTRAVIYVCGQCQGARQKWESENPPPQ